MRSRIVGVRTGGSGEEVDIKCSRDGDLRVNQFLPRYSMLVAAGKVFAWDITPSTAKAPDTALPTDSPEWTIYNANASGGPHIVLLKVSIITASGSTGLGLCVAATAGIGAQTAVTANYSTGAASYSSCLDGSAKQPTAYLGNNPSILGTQPAWTVFAAKDQAADAFVGSGLVANIDGMIIAPPKGGVFIAVVAPTGVTVLYDVTIVCAEVYLDFV